MTNLYSHGGVVVDGCSRDTSGTPKTFRISNTHEWPAELKAFWKSRSIRMSLPSVLAACLWRIRAFWMTICTDLEPLNSYCEDSRTAYLSTSVRRRLVMMMLISWYKALQRAIGLKLLGRVRMIFA